MHQWASKIVRPDIICHNRGCKNCFIIEIKLGSPGDDRKKIQDMMINLNCSFGYVISNMKNTRKTVVIYEYKLTRGGTCTEEKHKYKVNNGTFIDKNTSKYVQREVSIPQE